MEQAAGQEIKAPEIQAKDRLRSAQRQKILYDHFKNPSKLEMLKGLTPSDRPSPNTAVDEAGLRDFAEAFGKDTHTMLFRLAATSNNPIELYNIILNISNLKKVKSSYWKFEDSEDHFLRRSPSEKVGVSKEAEESSDPNPEHLLENFFYIMSTENIPLEDKKRILSEFSSVKTLMPPISGNEESLKIYGPESSFWSHVDGSWIDPKLAPKEHAGRSKKAIIASSIASGLRDRLKRSEATSQNASPASRAESAQPEDITGLIVDRIIADRARGAQLPARPAARGTESSTPEEQRFPQDSTAEDLGLPPGTDLSRVGLLSSTGQIKGLRPFALITLKDGGQRRVGFNPYSVAGKILVDDDRTVDSDQIEKFRNQDLKTYKYDTTRDILVQTEPVPKPRNVSPGPDASPAARTTPEPNKPSVQPEDLSGLSDDQLDRKLNELYLGRNRLRTIGDELDEIRNPNSAQLRQKLDLIIAYEDLEQQARSLNKEWEKRYKERETPEIVQPPAPTPRPPAPESTAPTPEEPSDSSSVRRPAVDPRFDRIPWETDQPDKENIIDLGTGDKDLVQELNEKLKEQVTDNVTFAVAPNVLKEYLTSIAQGMAKGGSIQAIGNDIFVISALQVEKRVSKATVKATVDIAIKNNPNKDGIEAELIEYKGNAAGNIGGAFRKALGGRGVREEIESLLANINTTVKTKLNEQIDPEVNPLWHTDTILISGDKVNIGFNRAAQPRPR